MAFKYLCTVHRTVYATPYPVFKTSIPIHPLSLEKEDAKGELINVYFVFLDDSVSFDGDTPNTRALGGDEKALVGLTEALAACGHTVIVGNRCTSKRIIAGVTWCPLDDIEKVVDQPVDFSVSFRAPALLGRIPAYHHLLWVTSHPDYLKHSRVAALLKHFRAGVLFSSLHQASLGSDISPACLLSVGVRTAFLEAAHRQKKERKKIPDPVAVLTLHPERSLDPILDLWSKQIQPCVPKARLLVVSSTLSKSCLGKHSPRMRLLFEKVESMSHQGVSILSPGSDQDMVALWRHARVHVYPLTDRDVCCWTLAESQACGVPAVALSAGGAVEAINNGTSGYCVPDHYALANVVCHILNNEDMFFSLSQGTSTPQCVRSWREAACTLATFCKTRIVPETMGAI